MKSATIILISGLFLFSCKNNESNDHAGAKDSVNTEQKVKSESEYTCPMHPEVIRKEPGTCPECGMELQIRS